MKLKSRKASKVLFFLIISFFLVENTFALNINGVLGLLDWSCLELQVIGVCWKGTIPGLIIKFWEPVLLIETVKKPGDTVIEGLDVFVSKAGEEATKNFASNSVGLSVPASSGSTSSSLTRTNLQFNDVHIYDFPFKDIITAIIGGGDCPSTPSTGFVKYLSELDAMEWRVGLMELLHPKSIASGVIGPICGVLGSNNPLCMGVWGPMYPRRGFLTHHSEVVGSAAAAVRAISIDSLEGAMSHYVLDKLEFNPAWETDKLQLIYPVSGSCIKSGQNPVSWESGKTSSNGKYLWVYWRMRICCVY